MKKEPRWVVPFLRALERTGVARTAAEDAGIDHTTAYVRRKRYDDFADAWDGAVYRYSVAKEAREAEELAALRTVHVRFAHDEQVQTAPGSPAAAHPLSPLSAAGAESPSPAEGGGADLIASGSQVRRAGQGRWGPRKEKLFFDELAATANVKRAAAAAGVSPNAVYARRLRDAYFRAKWAAVLETGRASIEMHLVEAANRSFEPDELDTAEVAPKVSVADAIRIVQVHGSHKQGAAADPYDDPSYDYDADIAEVRERLVQKLQALRRRDRVELLEQGWSYDESWDRDIPPGWVKGPDYVPGPGDEGEEDNLGEEPSRE